MITIDGVNGGGDTIDGGSTASPPTDTYDSMFVLPAQVITGMITPTFYGVDTTVAVQPVARQVLYVKVGGTSTTVTVVVPGAHPYTGIALDDLIVSGVSNTERTFHLPPVLLTDPASEVITVSYSQTTGVTAALITR